MSAIPGLNTAILDFCTRLDDGPRDEAAARRELPRRDPEEYKWLREAMASIEQPERRLKKLLAFVDKADVTSKDDEALAALEEIQDMIEDINLATEFGLMKGPKRVVDLIRATRDEVIRQVCGMIIAHASQNHLKLQLQFLESNVFDVLIPLLVNETHAGARASLVFAISCICRGCDAASALFLKNGGLGALLAVISGHAQDDVKTVSRCLGLAGYFAEAHSTTALPIATVSCALATTEGSAVSDSAAECAAAVLLKCSSTGQSGQQITKSMLEQLSDWYDRTTDSATPGIVALRSAYATARSLRTGNTNKASPTQDTLHTPICVPGIQAPLGLAAPPANSDAA